MKKNPIAILMHHVFEEKVINQSYVLPNNTHNLPRVHEYMETVNAFFYNNGLKPFNIDDVQIDEQKMVSFSAFISGYIRDNQKLLKDLNDDEAIDEDLVNLYRDSAHYNVKCSGSLKDYKYIFKEKNDYCVWKIDNPRDLAHSEYSPVDEIDSDKKCIILSMPFQIRPKQEDLRKWVYMSMHNSFEDQKFFDKNVNVYVLHYPIERPIGFKFSSILNTLREPDSYFMETDQKFVGKYMKSFLGENLKLDDDGNVLEGKVYSSDEFKRRMKNVVVISWCAGLHNASRLINVVDNYASKFYDKDVVQEGLKNAFILSYGVLPISPQNKCSGAYFFSNYSYDQERKEPFTKMFQPQFYEKFINREQDEKARITVMPDHQNFVVSLKLPHDLVIVDKKSDLLRIKGQENGHHISFLTAPNLASEDNYSYYQFQTVLKNAVSGKRGIHIFDIVDTSNPSLVMKSCNSVWTAQPYSR